MKAYTFDGYNLKYANHQPRHIEFTKSTMFPCERCMQEFREPDDGNMIWDPILLMWICGNCQTNIRDKS